MKKKDIGVLKPFLFVLFHKENTALHLAVENGYYNIVKLLLNYKNIDLNVKNSKGKTPAEIAKPDIKVLFNDFIKIAS